MQPLGALSEQISLSQRLAQGQEKAGAELAVAHIGKLFDPDIRPGDERDVDLAHGLAEIGPGIAPRTRRIGGNVVAGNELHLPRRHQFMGVLPIDDLVVIDVEPLALPGAGFVDYMHQREMALDERYGKFTWSTNGALLVLSFLLCFGR